MAHTDNSADARVTPPLISPICLGCGVAMRLSRIIPHHRHDDTEIRAYACGCGNEILQTVKL